MDRSKNYSVILRVRNEEQYIGYAIQSVVDNIGENCEIIIVNNASTDDSIRVLNLFEYLDIKTINIGNSEYSPGKAINLGVRQSKRDFSLVLSAHCEIKSFDVELVREKFKDEKVPCIFGKQLPVYLGKKITPRYMWAHFDDTPRENYYSEQEDRYFLHNAFAIYKTPLLKRYPFDEHWSGKEDRYWAQHIVKQRHNYHDNYKFLYEPSLECTHHYTSDGNTWKGIG
ncbi:MAG: glycosyltransferase family 2 protein [Pelagibacteraceae bacterium]|nr:glycosyltransferase family 2 protein [Pelagibacteraceae bacterium]